MSAYNSSTMSGFIPAESIMAGWLTDGKTPVVRFIVVCGRLPYPIFIVEPRLGAEMFAWKMVMDRLGTPRMHAVVVSDVISCGNIMALVTDHIDFHTSNPELRSGVDQCFNEMLAGNSPYQWPERTIKIPSRLLQQLKTGGTV